VLTYHTPWEIERNHKSYRLRWVEFDMFPRNENEMGKWVANLFGTGELSSSLICIGFYVISFCTMC
jgi:hypothetical protein